MFQIILADNVDNDLVERQVDAAMKFRLSRAARIAAYHEKSNAQNSHLGIMFFKVLHFLANLCNRAIKKITLLICIGHVKCTYLRKYVETVVYNILLADTLPDLMEVTTSSVANNSPELFTPVVLPSEICADSWCDESWMDDSVNWKTSTPNSQYPKDSPSPKIFGPIYEEA